MASPLTRQNRPDYFEPKIVELYRYLFNGVLNDETDDYVPSEGFWREFFLLKPDRQKLYDILVPLTADNLFHMQTQTQTFFRRAIEEAGSGHSPQNENALENLTGFLSAVLTKQYTNPNTDVIEVLAGLDAIDKLVSELVQGLEAIIRQSSNLQFRRKAVMTALAMVSGSYQTTLVTYFIHRDLFPALMKYVHESTTPTPEVMILLGLLANYNKFESQNPYQTRLEDFVNDKTIGRLVDGFADVCNYVRDQYVAVQDDTPTPWTISNTLSMVGLRSLTPDGRKSTPPTEEEAKVLFSDLPPPNAAIILSAYSWVSANKIFALRLVSVSGQGSPEPAKSDILPAFFSATSYLCHHAHRGERSLRYATLSLLTIRLLSEDSTLSQRLSSSDNKIAVRLARQRPPLLPHIDKPRVPTTVILDICSDTITHNLRKRLSISLLSLALQVLLRIISRLEATKTRLQHHWTNVWGSLFSLLRFLTQYAPDLVGSASAHQIRSEICAPLSALLAFCLSSGDNFLPDPASYDDLFYKLIESSAVLTKFVTAYSSNHTPSNASQTSSTTPISLASSLLSPSTSRLGIGPGSTSAEVLLYTSTNALSSVTAHYQTLLTFQKTHQSPTTIQKIIREGYDTLPDITSSLSSTAISGTATGNRGGLLSSSTSPATHNGLGSVDFGHWDKWRESSWKGEIKKILRVVVEDVREYCLSV